jgi:hypothetical protein
VSNHFYSLANQIVLDGHECEVLATGQMHVRMAGGDVTIDVFTSWQNRRKVFNSYFAVSGTLSDQVTFFKDQFGGLPVSIPLQYKEILGLTYGEGWNIPDPYFHFSPSEHVGKIMQSLQRNGAKSMQTFQSVDS